MNPPVAPAGSGLFAEPDALKPLAERMRPRSLDEIVGQQRLVGPDQALRRALEAGKIHSMVLWGPPGCGKTTLALLVARYAEADFRAISAVLSGLPDVRKALAEAEVNFAQGRRTVLFVDEVHRFNKTQQDAFLPHIEKGVIIFIGATTENPSFELNSALLSRCRVHVLEPISTDDIVAALKRALTDGERGLGELQLQVGDASLDSIAQAADGDVRRALTLLEIAAELAEDKRIDEVTLVQVLADRTRRFDKQGEQFYDQISALHKSVRSSDPDAAVYWLCRMLDGGVDPLYLARRMTRIGGRRRPGRAARLAHGAGRVGYLRTSGQPRGRAGAGAAGDLAGDRAEEQRRLHGLQQGPRRDPRRRHAGGADAPAQCTDQADERPRLRQGLPVRPRRRGRHRARSAMPAR